MRGVTEFMSPTLLHYAAVSSLNRVTLFLLARLSSKHTKQSMTSGFFYNTAKMSKSGDYKTIKNQHTVYIHPSSVLHKQEVQRFLG